MSSCNTGPSWGRPQHPFLSKTSNRINYRTYFCVSLSISLVAWIFQNSFHLELLVILAKKTLNVFAGFSNLSHADQKAIKIAWRSRWQIALYSVLYITKELQRILYLLLHPAGIPSQWAAEKDPTYACSLSLIHRHQMHLWFPLTWTSQTKKTLRDSSLHHWEMRSLQWTKNYQYWDFLNLFFCFLPPRKNKHKKEWTKLVETNKINFSQKLVVR